MAGITDAGFIKPTESEIEAALVAAFKAEFGNDITLAPETFLGQQLAIYKSREIEFWDVLEDVYFSLFVNTAAGVNLDRAAFPFVRRPAQKASVILRFTGDDATTVPIDTIVETSEGTQYITLEEQTIFDSSGGTDTVDIQAISVLAGLSGNQPVDTIVELPTPISGIDSVTNPSPATGGSNIETDASFLARIKVESQTSKSSSVSAVKNALLLVDGVTQATINENDTDAYIGSLPPHSIQCVVGGTATDADVGQAIFDAKPAGIGTYGAESYDIEDNSVIYTINFDRSTLVNIYVDLYFTTNSSYDAANEDTIKDRILEYIGGVDPNGVSYSGLEAGDDVRTWKVSASIFNLENQDELGIEEVVVELSRTTDPSSGEGGNLVMGPTEEAITDFTFITIYI